MVMNGQMKKNSESKRKMGSLSEVLGREKSRSVIEEEPEGKRSKKSRQSGVMEESNNELTLAEIKMNALMKKSKKKRKVDIREEKKKRQLMLIEDRDMEVMTVEDSEFYDFDKDRVERSFKKGQVWAIYEDVDGMPRHYVLIDEVVSSNPFEVKMSWLDLQNDRDESLTSLEKMGFHKSCGIFEVAKKDSTNLLNIFSHLVECERAAKKLYRIYPTKGSIWALYKEKELDVAGKESFSEDKRCYDIVVFLTSFSEIHGLSMAYLEKVKGFRAVFKRREIGYHAITWLDKDEFRLFSHQIPARKLSEEEAPHYSGGCWELDPASLPPDLLSFSCRK